MSAEPTVPGAVEFSNDQAQDTVVVKVQDYPMSDLASLFDETFPALFPALQERGISPTDAPFALYTRMPTDTVDLELGIAVSKPLAEPIQVGALVLSPSQLPAGEHARTTFLGPYDQLRDAWRNFMHTMEASDRQPIAPFWEHYVSNPLDTAPEALRTDLITSLQ